MWSSNLNVSIERAHLDIFGPMFLEVQTPLGMVAPTSSVSWRNSYAYLDAPRCLAVDVEDKKHTIRVKMVGPSYTNHMSRKGVVDCLECKFFLASRGGASRPARPGAAPRSFHSREFFDTPIGGATL